MQQRRDLYVRFAELARLCQETEVLISTHTLFVHWIRSIDPASPPPDMHLATRLRRLTLGQSIRHLEEQYARVVGELEPDELTGMHERAVAARNKLMHNFFLEFSEDFSGAGELARAQRKLGELAESIELAHHVYSAALDRTENLLREVGILAPEGGT